MSKPLSPPAEPDRAVEAEIIQQPALQGLASARARESNLAEAIRRRFAPFGGVELDLPPREDVREPQLWLAPDPSAGEAS
jgi:antitoxin FitA